MKLRKRIVFGLICLSLLSGCGQKQEEARPDVSALGPIEVIVREDGSGTRTQFESLMNTQESGTKAIASSTEDVISLVGQNPAAIGYAAMSALTDSAFQKTTQSDSSQNTNSSEVTSASGNSTINETTDSMQENTANIKILSINGIEPSEQTIRNKKYPLTRKYYLAWSGDQNDLEREFITYVCGAGQKYVAEEAVPVAKESTFLSMKPSGTLTITGSTSMTPMLEKLADSYKTYNPNAEITITSSDSTQGLIDAMQGKADIAMSSRDLKDYEQELLTTREIAADAIDIIVNTGNALTNLSSDELRQIYDGTITEWGSLN